MTTDTTTYSSKVQDHVNSIFKDALQNIIKNGIQKQNYIYITIQTKHPEVIISQILRERHPKTITIILQHQFSNLVASDTYFSVTLSFSNKPEMLHIPFSAITEFNDSSTSLLIKFLPKKQNLRYTKANNIIHIQDFLNKK